MPQWKEHRPSILRPKFAKNLELGILFCFVLFESNHHIIYNFPGGIAEAVAAAPVPVRSQHHRAEPGPARVASAPHIQRCALPLTAARGVRAPCSRQKVNSRFHQILSCGKSYSWWGWVPKALVLKVCSLDHKSGIA